MAEEKRKAVEAVGEKKVSKKPEAVEKRETFLKEELQNYVDVVIQAIKAKPEALENLTEDIADKISEVIEDEPTFKKEIIKRAMADKSFKQMVVRKLLEELS